MKRTIQSQWIHKAMAAMVGMALFSVTFGSAYAGMPNGCFFSLKMLGDVNSNGKVDNNEVGNGMTVGNPSGWSTASRGNPNPPIIGQDPIAFQTETIGPAYWPRSAVTNACTVLHLPQTAYTGGTVESNAEQALTFTYTPGENALRSGHFRFRWDGYILDATQAIIFGDGWTWNGSSENSRGYAFFIGKDTGGNTHLYLWIGGKNGYLAGFAPQIGVWYDVLFSAKNTSSMDVTVMAANYIKKGTITPQSGDYVKFNVNSTSKIIVGGQLENATAWGTPGNGNSRKVFRGALACLDLYEGTLSDTELMAIAAGYDGTTWSLGSKNGSDYEFGGDPVAEYDPLSMPFSSMRGRLTAANPSLTLRFKISETDAGLSKFLTLNPLPIDVGGTCPLTVTVNGNAVGALGHRTAEAEDVASGAPCTFYVPGRYWVGDAEGYVRVVLQRTGSTAGTLGIDSLVLSGSWQIGFEDNNGTEFCLEHYAPEVFYIGDWDISNHVRKATYPIGNTRSATSNLVLRCWMPEGVAKRCRMRLKTRVSNTGVDGNMANFALKVGAHTVYSGQVKKGDRVEAEMMPGVFSDGFNDIQILNFAAEDGRWMQYDFFRLECRPLYGFSIVLQ